MSDYAGDNPERYRELVDDFTGEVDAALSERALIASTGKTGSVVSLVAGGYYPMYWWYIPHGRHHTSPLDRADTNSAISPAALASSANSSGSGFGGGFSGGGGGGVGGGGGGSF